MKEYIESHDNKEHTILKEFNEMRFISKCHKRNYAYATIKAWFLNKYPDVKKFGIEEEKAEAEATTTEEKAVA